jgi:Protein of unknown function (DUF2961)
MLFESRIATIVALFVAGAVAMAQNNSGPQQPAGAEGMVQGLGSLPILNANETRSISAENPTGGKGLATAEPLLPGDPYHLSSPEAAGWKKHPFLAPKAHQTVMLMNVDGPGVIEHIWMVPDDSGFLFHGRGCVLRMYWDGETSPSVEVPVTDFFAVGHDMFAPVNSLPVVDNPGSALNSFWPMPFRKHARITFTNDSDRDEGLLAYQITYSVGRVAADAGYFHAQYRQGSWVDQNPYVILDRVRGEGQYVGTVLEVAQTDDVWFGEGEVQVYLDGDTNLPTISGTGTEDYFLFSYGFPEVRSTLYSGVPLKQGVKPGDAGGTAGALWTMYRWHIMDPIRFHKDFRMTIEGLGGLKGQTQHGFVKRRDMLSSVAYWYQTEPHAPFPLLPSYAERSRDPFGDFPVSGFDLRQATVSSRKKDSTWQPCGRFDSNFRKFYSGFVSSDGAFVCNGVSLAVTASSSQQERGFMMQTGDSRGAVAASWIIPRSATARLRLEYALVPASSSSIRFSVEASCGAGKPKHLLDEVLAPGAQPRESVIALPACSDKLQFAATQSAGESVSTIWFRPEL